MSAAPDTAASVPLAHNPVVQALQEHLALCQEALVLATQENQALAVGADYDPFAYHNQRKSLLPRLADSLMALRKWRQSSRQSSPAERVGCAETQALFQTVQSVLMKVLLLDRENQQALLRRGLLPAGHLPTATAQQPHCVAALYRRHVRG